MMKIEAFLAEARDPNGWPIDQMIALGWLKAEAEAGRWILTGIRCDDAGNPVGDRREIVVSELGALRFPLAAKQYDLFAPPDNRRAYAGIEIEPPRALRDNDAALSAAYIEERNGDSGSADDFYHWAKDRGDKRARDREGGLREVYKREIEKRGPGRPPKSATA